MFRNRDAAILAAIREEGQRDRDAFQEEFRLIRDEINHLGRRLSAVHVNYAHSTNTNDQVDELLWRFDLRTRQVVWRQADTSVINAVQFVWGREPEQRQAWRCSEYLREVAEIALRNRGLTVADVSGHDNLLGAEFPDRGVNLSGGTDLLVIPRRGDRPNDHDYSQWPRTARALVELKKPEDPTNPTRFHQQDRNQAIFELLALDQKAGGAVFALLTDLMGQWFFFWLGDNREVLQLEISNFATGVAAPHVDESAARAPTDASTDGSPPSGASHQSDPTLSHSTSSE